MSPEISAHVSSHKCYHITFLDNKKILSHILQDGSLQPTVIIRYSSHEFDVGWKIIVQKLNSWLAFQCNRLNKFDNILINSGIKFNKKVSFFLFLEII